MPALPMPPLHRHQLARLSAAGWAGVRAQPWDAGVRDCIGHWATRRLPLVVTRQPQGDDDALALGLPAPRCWHGQRIALRVPRAHVAGFDEFPPADQLVLPLPAPARRRWRRLCAELAALGARAHVYGSHGWQHLSGLQYLHAGSDIDLWTAVEDAAQADAVAALLERCGPALPRRLDGELLFRDGRACAWREWLAWRNGRSRAILCKTLHTVALVRAAWPEEARAPDRTRAAGRAP